MDFIFDAGRAVFDDCEHGTTGPGAVSSPNRRVLSDGDVQAYTPERVVEGWNPRE